MNRLTGKITSIEHNDHMSLVDVAVGDDIFSATLLETPQSADYLQAGREVTLMFKETEVSLAKNLSGLISLRNRFTATVLGIEHGTIMSAVKLDYCGMPLTSIVTTRGAVRLNLVVGDVVEGLVKANEMVLSHGL